MKISRFFKAKKVSDRCQQHKNNYEKIIVLKQDFDAATKKGEADRDFGEAMRLKTELKKTLYNIELYLKKFKVWKTIKLGTGLKNADDFIRALEDDGYQISTTAKSIMQNPAFRVLSEKTKFELVIISIADLGFPKGATTEEIYKRAKELGLELCPPEVGPQLRLQYKDQPTGGWLNVATETIKGPNGDLSIFIVVRVGSESWLGYERSSYVCDTDRRWVFARRKI